jgi:hypothetical protein
VGNDHVETIRTQVNGGYGFGGFFVHGDEDDEEVIRFDKMLGAFYPVTAFNIERTDDSLVVARTQEDIQEWN